MIKHKKLPAEEGGTPGIRWMLGSAHLLPVGLGAALSALTVVVYVVAWNDGGRAAPDPLTAGLAVGAFVVLAAALAGGLSWLFARVSRPAASDVAGPLPWLDFSWSATGVLRASAVIFLLWAPIIVASYPCTMDWDTLNQLFQFATDAPVRYGARAMDIVVDAKFIDHDPVATTLVFGLFWQIGCALGDQNAGLFLYVVVQSAFSALALGVLCCYVRRLGLSRRAALVVLAFCALFPPFPRFAATMLKDSFFAPFFLIYAMGFVEVFRTRGEALGSRRFVLLFALAALGCIAGKKTGIYIVAVSAVVMAACLRGWRGRAAAAGLAPIAVALSLTVLLYPALDVRSVGRQEALAVPLQQSAAVLLEHPDDVRPWERAAVEAVIDCDELEKRFNPTLADPVKTGFRAQATSADLVRYGLAYLNQGLRHPLLYFETALRVDGPMLAPMTALAVPMWTGSEGIEAMTAWEGESAVDFSQPEWVEGVASLANHFDWWLIAMLGMFGTMGFYGGWLPLAVAAVVLARNRSIFPALAPVLVSVAVLLLSPVSVTRYVLPLIYCAPLLTALAVASLRAGGKGERRGNR